MSIPETFLKIKRRLSANPKRIAAELAFGTIVLIVSFFMGRMSAMASARQNVPVVAPTSETNSRNAASDSLMQTILGDGQGDGGAAPANGSLSQVAGSVTPAPQNSPIQASNSSQDPAQNPSAENFAASKSGKVYYPISCKGLNRVKLANRIYFATESSAQNSGRTLSKTCK